MNRIMYNMELTVSIIKYVRIEW